LATYIESTLNSSIVSYRIVSYTCHEDDWW